MATALADLVLRRHVALQRLSAAELQKVDAFIEQIAAELARRLSGQNLTELSRSRVERMLERLSDYLGTTLGAYRQDIMKDLNVIADDQAQATLVTLRSLDVSTDFNAPTALQIRAAALESPLLVHGPDGGKLLKGFLTGWTNTEKARVTNAVRLGYATGQTNAQISQGVRGTRALNYNDGLLAVTKRNADTIVHTAIQHVASAARQAVLDANDDITKGIRWIATLDNRTCPRCGALDQVEFPLDKGPRPPLHPRCRCTSVPVFKAEFAILQQGGSRPSVGDKGVKQVSSKLGYYDWLKTQPASFQDFALGPTRGKLLRNGGLTSSQFARLQLDKRFQPMSLDEARMVDPLAFDKAGV
jgi:SPP1 gp7 family putative phage head morphogenesis protein